MNIIYVISFWITLGALLPQNAYMWVVEAVLAYLFYRELERKTITDSQKKSLPLKIASTVMISLFMIPFYWMFMKQYADLRPAVEDALKVFVGNPCAETLFSPSIFALVVASVGSIPFIWLLISSGLKFVAQFWRNMDLFERRYFAGGFGFLAVLLLYFASQTSIWTFPIKEGHFVREISGQIQISGSFMNDVFLDTDTYFGSWFANDRATSLRHPFYTLHVLSVWPLVMLFYCGIHLFVSSAFYSMALSFSFTQTLQFLVCGILLLRLVGECTDKNFGRWVAVLWFCSFIAIWSFIPERLIPSLFWLLVAVYYWNTSGTKLFYRLVLAILAMGSTLFSFGLVTLLPITEVLSRKTIRKLFSPENFLYWVTLLFAVGAVFSAFKLDETDLLRPVFSATQVKENTLQFSHFMESCVFMPYWTVEESIESQMSPTLAVCQVKTPSLPSWILGMGALMFLGCVVSGTIYWRDYFTQCAWLWLAAGMGIMIVLGFGSTLDTMTLFGSYFAWAVLPLSVLWLGRFSEGKWRVLRYAVPMLAVIALGLNLYFLVTVTECVRDTYILISPEMTESGFFPPYFSVRVL